MANAVDTNNRLLYSAGQPAMLTSFPDTRSLYREAYLRAFTVENEKGEAAVRFETFEGTAVALVTLHTSTTAVAVKNGDGDYIRVRDFNLPTYSTTLREALADAIERELRTALLDFSYERTLNERVDPVVVREEALRLCLPHANRPNAVIHQIIAILERCAPPQVTYLLDSPEWTDIQRPEDTLKYNAGQCEAHAVLVASLCTSVSIPTAVVIVESKELKTSHALNYICVGKGDDVDRVRATIVACYRERGYQTPEWPEFLISDREGRVWALADTTSSAFLGSCKPHVQMGFMEYVTGKEGKTEGRWIAPTKVYSKYEVGAWVESYLYQRPSAAAPSSVPPGRRLWLRTVAFALAVNRSISSPPLFLGQLATALALVFVALVGLQIAVRLDGLSTFFSAWAPWGPDKPHPGINEIDTSLFRPGPPPGGFAPAAAPMQAPAAKVGDTRSLVEMARELRAATPHPTAKKSRGEPLASANVPGRTAAPTPATRGPRHAETATTAVTAGTTSRIDDIAALFRATPTSGEASRRDPDATCYVSRDGSVAAVLLQRPGADEDITIRPLRPGGRGLRLAHIGQRVAPVDDDGAPLPPVDCNTLRFDDSPNGPSPR